MSRDPDLSLLPSVKSDLYVSSENNNRQAPLRNTSFYEWGSVISKEPLMPDSWVWGRALWRSPVKAEFVEARLQSTDLQHSQGPGDDGGSAGGTPGAGWSPLPFARQNYFFAPPNRTPAEASARGRCALAVGERGRRAGR